MVYKPERGRLDHSRAPGARDKVRVDIPIDVMGRNRDLLDVYLVAVRADTERGAPWTPAWTWDFLVVKRDGADWIELSLDRQTYRRLIAGPVKLRVVLALVIFETQSTTRFGRGSGWVDVPNFGKVTLQESAAAPRSAMNPLYATLVWRTPLRDPEQKFISSMRDPKSGAIFGYEHPGSYPPTSEPPSMSPVVSYAMPFEPMGPNRGEEYDLPKNELAEFTVERPLTVVRRDIDIPAITLKDYVIGN